MASLDQRCVAALARDTAQPAIEFDKQWVTWGEVRHLAECLSQRLDASGINEGTTIALVARNRPSSLAALLGLLARRCSIRMVYPFQSAEALAKDLVHIAPTLVVADAQDYSDVVSSALLDSGIAGIALRNMEAVAVPGLEHCSDPGVTQTHPVVEILTSGTTGPPKPFAISYETISEHLLAPTAVPVAQQAAQISLPPALLMFPVSNISGLYSTLPPLLNGQRCVLLERFTVPGWHDHLVRFRPQTSGLPPAGIQMVLDADIPPADLACLSAIGTGAAPLDTGVHRAFEKRYGVPILLSYGATEFGGPVTRMTLPLLEEWGASKFGSVGRALPGAQLRITDPETGKPLAPGEEGILEVISPRMGPDWIRTADIALLDAEGFLFHRGRADGAILRGGFKLLPNAIEGPLLRHPAIAAAVVVGIPDHRLGQVPAAVISLRKGMEAPSEQDLEAHLREHVPATHIPTAWRIVDELPRTPSMKVDLPAVRKLFNSDSTN